MSYTQDQAKKIYQSAKEQGLNPDLVMAKLVAKGATIEGIDMNQAREFAAKQTPQEPGYFQRVGSGLKEQALRAIQGVEQGAQALEQGVNTTDANGIITPKGVATAVGGLLRSGLRSAGSAANAVVAPVLEAPGVKQGLETLATGAAKGLEAIPGGQDVINKLSDLAAKNPEFTKDVEDIFNVLTAGVGAKVAKVGAKGVVKAGEAVTNTAIEGVDTGLKLAEGVLPKSDEIMNRVARLTPKQATTFEKLAGKSHGEYLRETGNFGTPDEIIKKESEKFTQSLKSVDDTLAKLPGTYKSGAIEDALAGLSEKAAATSSKNVKSPLLAKITEYEAKLNDGGLTISEINDLKRLFERNVKLGYNKLMNADKVEQATNIDNALRNWQVEKAKELGFKNIADLNKQTQLSKFIIDKLGDQVVGKSGLNDITLTDWIMLSGGDPTAVGGFLTKKFFSSKKVQSKIAEMLNKGEVKGQILPEITTSKKLPQQQSEKVLEKASTNNTTSGLKSKGTIPENSLISEAKKYKSAEEFVTNSTELTYKNLQENPYSIKVYGKDFNEPVEYHRAGAIKKNGDIWLTDNEAGAKQYSSAGGGTKIGSYVVQSKNPLIIDTAGGKYANGNVDISKILTKEEIGKGYTNNPDLKQKFIDYAKKNGYDAVQFADSFPEVS